MMPNEITRRNALAGIASIGAVGMTASAGHTFAGLNRVVSEQDLGWDSATKQYTLPELPYSYDALSSAIDAQTMEIHHSKHHAGYVKGANNAIKNLESIRWNPDQSATIQHWQRQLSFHIGGHVNHTLFWSGMKSEFSGGGGQPTGNLLNKIIEDFGSFNKFVLQFKLAAAKVEGSGWGWLIYEPISRRLMITQMQNQQDMMFAGAIPLLGVDVWEHAYYLKYQNKRAAYIDAFMRVINWEEISKRFESARK
jgi:superoxide dismutase, Fe-Mn family